MNTEGAGAYALAFPPDYRRSHRIYVDYSDANHDVRVDEYRTSAAAPLRASVKSRRAVLRVQHPDTLQHYGGTMQFDAAGRMYVSVGDGGGRGDPFDNARDVGSLLGKILRIYPRPSNGRPYSVPRSNPFVGKPGRNAIYSYGLRNPYRFSLDRKTRHIAIGDVGQHLYEEVDYATLRSARGANFGWPEFEGFHDYDPSRPGPTPAVDPTFEYPHRDPGGGAAYGCAVIGGYVVRDSKLPVLAGRYLYTDECTGDLRSFRPTMTGARRPLARPPSRLPGRVWRGTPAPDLHRFANRARVPSARGALRVRRSSPGGGELRLRILAEADRARGRPARTSNPTLHASKYPPDSGTHFCFRVKAEVRACCR